MYPSLFNDVFGPIMIGPSSSACAGPTRIGQIARGVCGGTPAYYRICYVPGSGRASFRVGMATNLGLIAGVLGWGPEDARLYHAQEEAEKQGMSVEVVLEDIPGNTNPNAMLLTMRNAAVETSTILGHSVGGGTIAILEIDGFPVEDIKGEEYVLLVQYRSAPGFDRQILSAIEDRIPSFHDRIAAGLSKPSVTYVIISKSTGGPRDFQLHLTPYPAPIIYPLISISHIFISMLYFLNLSSQIWHHVL